MNKHTKGPWTVSKTKGGRLAVYGRSNLQPICIFATGEADDTSPFRNAKNNAPLVAAAPQLLATLTALLEHGGHLTPFGDGSISSIRKAKRYLETVDAARAIVGRLEGAAT